MSEGLTPGATIPDFELPDDTGVKRRLSDLQGDNAMVLCGRPSPYQLWADLQDLFRRIKPDFDPTSAGARAACQAAQR